MKIQTLLTGFAATAIILSVSACRTDNEQMIKRARLAGNENLRLKKEIEQKDARIAELKQQTEQTQQKIRTLQEQFDRTSKQAHQFDIENQQFKEDFRQKDSQIAELLQQVNLINEKDMRTQEQKTIANLLEILAKCENRLAKYEPVEAPPVIPFSLADANEPAQQK
jgi:septal ring factor EnvC (AmiA/AmiB activator)